MSDKVLNINEALSAIMADVGSIGKDTKNAQQGFMYRGIDTIMDALHPHFVKHGVVVLPEVIAERRLRRSSSSPSVSSRGQAPRSDEVSATEQPPPSTPPG